MSTSSRVPDTIDDVAVLLGRSRRDVTYIAYGLTDKQKYRRFAIPKKGGGQREIVAPEQPLRDIQATLAELFNELYRPRSCVHGFVAGKSTTSNAKRHARRRVVLNIDLKDFFPSIHFGRVRGLLRAYSFGREAADLVARLCCYDRRLPQGAPSSPILSNMICSRMDGEIARLCRRRGVVYSRYADDMSFSRINSKLPDQIARVEGREVTVGHRLREIIETDNTFTINEAKVRLQLRNSRQSVTGLTVNRFPNVDRRMVRRVRGILHAIDKYGLELAQQEYNARYRRSARVTEEADIREVVRGYLAFIHSVRSATIPPGEDSVYMGLLKKAQEHDERLQPWYYSLLEEASSALHHHDAWEAAELSLRNALHVALRNHYGTGWAAAVKSAIEDKVFADATARESAKGEGRHGVLSYIYPQQLQAIVRQEWDVVKSSFVRNNKRRVVRLLDPLKGLRTDHSHHNTTSVDDHLLKTASLELIQEIKPECRF